MERLKLTASSRETAGKGLPKLRNSGFVPGVIYGKKIKPSLVQIPFKDLEKATTTEAGFNAIFELSVDGKDQGLVRIREYQAHPIKRNFTHVDFQVVDLKETVDVDVPVAVIGKSEGVKKGGVLELQRRSLHLRCLVTQIPEHINIDVSTLEIGQSVHANDVKLPEGVSFPHEGNFTILAVVPPQKEEEAKPAATAEAAAPGEVPTTAQGPKTEEGKEAAAKEATAPAKAQTKGKEKA